ncbi:hypothetical protein GQ44DRAFT_720787 [Phaeosphaeriaceae sp. PMI808]|nr:hypothetical protein GQ44DRAFT_720787 [Phaeosphaeriaceae sp. PMI808]
MNQNELETAEAKSLRRAAQATINKLQSIKKHRENLQNQSVRIREAEQSILEDEKALEPYSMGQVERIVAHTKRREAIKPGKQKIADAAQMLRKKRSSLERLRRNRMRDEESLQSAETNMAFVITRLRDALYVLLIERFKY